MFETPLPKFNFKDTFIVDIVLVFDNVTRRWFFPETPELEDKRIVGIQSLYREIYNKTIYVPNDIAGTYPTILLNNMAEYRVTLYEKNKEAPVIENMPLKSFIVLRASTPGANTRTPGGYIKPFYINIDVKRSYIENNFFPFQPYFAALKFYTMPL